MLIQNQMQIQVKNIILKVIKIIFLFSIIMKMKKVLSISKFKFFLCAPSFYLHFLTNFQILASRILIRNPHGK